MVLHRPHHNGLLLPDHDLPHRFLCSILRLLQPHPFGLHLGLYIFLNDPQLPLPQKEEHECQHHGIEKQQYHHNNDVYGCGEVFGTVSFDGAVGDVGLGEAARCAGLFGAGHKLG